MAASEAQAEVGVCLPQMVELGRGERVVCIETKTSQRLNLNNSFVTVDTDKFDSPKDTEGKDSANLGKVGGSLSCWQWAPSSPVTVGGPSDPKDGSLNWSSCSKMR